MKADNDHLARVIKQDEQVALNNPPKVPEIPNFSFDKNAVLYTAYLLFRCNIIARNNLNAMVAEMQKPVPLNLAEWLVKESMK